MTCKQGGQKFIENLNMLYHVANIGDSRSLAIHPASTTHSQLSDTDMKAQVLLKVMLDCA